MLPGFYLFLVDRYLRFLQSRNRVYLRSARVLPCETLELNFSKNPGQCDAPVAMDTLTLHAFKCSPGT